MKTSNDPRHKKRQEIIKNLFTQSFLKQPTTNPIIQKILDNQTSIDDKIRSIAPEFPIEKINKTDLAILRLGVYELTIDLTQPKKVIIDEAIELAKEFGGENSAGFINGALGKLVRDIKNENT